MPINTGTLVTAPIRPYDSLDAFPTHEEQYGKGGYRAVADITERDAIPIERRKEGMLVRTLDDGKLWELGGNLITWYEQDLISSIAGANVSITDVSNYFSGNNSEAITQEIGARITPFVNKSAFIAALPSLANGSYRVKADNSVQDSRGVSLPTQYSVSSGVATLDVAALYQYVKGRSSIGWVSQIAAAGLYQPVDTVAKADGSGYWQNTVAGNATNPDAGGAGWADSDDWIDVRKFGAKCDGVTDDTAALQAALNAVNKFRRRVVITGVLTIRDTIIVPSNCEITGVAPSYPVAGVELDNCGAIVVAANNIMSGKVALDISNSQFARITNLSMWVVGESMGSVVNNVTAISNPTALCSYPLIDNVRISKFGNGAIKINGFNTGTITKISRARITSCRGHFIHFNNNADSWIEDSDIGYYTGQNTTDYLQQWAGIYIQQGGNCSITNCYAYNMGYGLWVENANHVQAVNCRFEKHNYVGVRITNSYECLMANTQTFNNGFAQGIPYTASGGNLGALGSGVGFQIDGASSKNKLANCLAYNNIYGDGTDYMGVGILVTGDSTFNEVNGFLAEGLYRSGGVIDRASNNMFRGFDAIKCRQYGMTLVDTSGGNIGSNDNQFLGVYINSCGQEADNTRDGIYLQQYSSRNLFAGVTVRRGVGAIQHRFGVRIDATCDANSLYSSDFQQSGRTGAISDLGANTEIASCRGVATYVDGLATVPAASTSVVVTHSLARTPTARNIQVTPTTSGGAATQFWVSNVTATQFTINTNVAPGGAGMGFSWSAQVIR